MPSTVTTPVVSHFESVGNDTEIREMRTASPFDSNPISQVKKLCMGSKLNVLLFAVPLGFLSAAGDWSEAATFTFNFMALIPLAAMLGDFTEDLALRSNEAIGALINVTFGNATEMIISIFALKAGMYDIIKQSLAGSVLGNMLLVLGCSFLAGGMREKQHRFNATAANVYCSLLLLSTMTFVVPTAFVQLHPNQDQILHVSRLIALISLSTYCAYIGFQLITHKFLFDGKGEHHPHHAQPISEEAGAQDNDDDDDDDDEEPQFTFWFAFVGMGVVAVLISFCSDFIVGAIEGTAKEIGMSKHFIGVILLPIVGNAAEHATAVTQGYKGNMDISLGVAIGSSIQVSAMVVPFIVIVAWMIGAPLDMNFHPFSVAALFVSVVTTNSLVVDGKAHWLEGLMLLSAYAILCVAYFYAPDGSD
eukprot:PhM_4_TR11307/c0_g1_i1/m.46962/K07300/chaA, CAX; Ca2+:H+ antiporter